MGELEGEREQVSRAAVRRIRHSLSLLGPILFAAHPVRRRGLFSRFCSLFPCLRFSHCFAGFREQRQCSPSVACFFKHFFFCFFRFAIPGNYIFPSNLSYVVCFLPKIYAALGKGKEFACSAVRPSSFGQTSSLSDFKLFVIFTLLWSLWKFPKSLCNLYRQEKQQQTNHQSNPFWHGIKRQTRTKDGKNQRIFGIIRDVAFNS